MNKEQIEEMARAIANKCEGLGESGCFNEDNCIGKRCHECIAEHLYNAGYRKQEWISVDERLPEREGYYLTSTIRGVIMIGAFFSYYGATYNPQFKYDVTHWMPLPEPPKMKGGAE